MICGEVLELVPCNVAEGEKRVSYMDPTVSMLIRDELVLPERNRLSVTVTSIDPVASTANTSFVTETVNH